MSQKCGQLLDLQDDLLALAQEWTAGNYSAAISGDDLSGHSATVAQYGDAINTINEFETTLDSGHRLNLLRIRS